ncbi:unnamed protein product [Adineta steineri]|uniref:Calcineurin-like phosphoesterase domain-containing protein n=1 Tax=Adineta steineri TaxID=433720 RepID=A0A814VWC4_9BILA|nr:unnamed protein product [Adineta steineri]CAF1192828.1 unnamed protein product [Adineta steineri]CAF1211037.1 unnamed protein product [Adineta steineri]CAF3628425.1 unnamed protein product [Adineta steineri]CAF3638413.1 unnamed protein product [Adineta steineri]
MNPYFTKDFVLNNIHYFARDMSDEKIYAISDLHVDQIENMKWVEQLSSDRYLNDTVIIAGDITHVLTKLTQTLKLFKSKFKNVYYCPGNHELWTQSQMEDEELQVDNSIEKFHHIIKLCDSIGVHTKPGVTDQGVTIVPLFGWYDESLHKPHPEVESDLRLWSDNYRCKWTNEVPQTEAAKYFVGLNKKYIFDLNKNNNKKIITFSHFLTSKKLMQAYRDEMQRRRDQWRENKNDTTSNQEQNVIKANFSLVAGTELLGEQLQIIKPQVHIFGHSHRKMVLDIGDGITYVNNPLGYVKERETGLIEPPHELYEIKLIDK